MSTQKICQIPGNPDIAGIGVRLSVYLQACTAIFELNSLSTAMELPALIQGNESPFTQLLNPPNYRMAYLAVEKKHLGVVMHYELGLIMIGFAIIISAITEARSGGLTPYHALIILNISQINNLAGISLLMMRGLFFCWEHGRRMSDFFVTPNFWIAYVPLMVHTIMMSSLGLYFWSNLKPFLKYVDEEGDCQPITFLWVFGQIDVSNNVLRVFSLGFYAVGAVPIIGPFILGGLLVLAGSVPLFALVASITITLLCLGSFPILVVAFAYSYNRANRAIKILHARLITPRSTHPTSIWAIFAAMLTIAFPFVLIYFMLSTELTIRINRTLIEPGIEDRWTYGQILTLTTSLISFLMHTFDFHQMMAWPLKRQNRAVTEDNTENINANAGNPSPGVNNPRPTVLPDSQSHHYADFHRSSPSTN